MRCLSLLILLLLAASARAGELKLASLFTDHAVLQQGMDLPVWGTAGAGEKVIVTFASQTRETTAGSDGRWSVTLAPLTPRDAGDLTARGSSTAITLHDVVVGEVWVCAGQSNMELSMRFQTDLNNELKKADVPPLRLFHEQRAGSDTPLSDCIGDWQQCNAKSVAEFSAVAYYFGKSLHESLNVPVGVIECAWSGSAIETWISAPSLAADTDGPAIVERWKKAAADYPALMDQYRRDVANYDIAVAKAKADKTKPPPEPMTPTHKEGLEPANAAFMVDQAVYHYPVQHPSALFNGMIAPLAPAAVRGVAWYQGEGNFDRPLQYKRLLPLMLRDWRSAWRREDLPFLIVQLPIIGRKEAPKVFGQDSFAPIREAQLLAATSASHVALTVNIDNGVDVDLHPKDKRPVGQRLSVAARAMVYGEKIPHIGPRLQSCSVEGDHLRLKLTDDGGGLIAGAGGKVTGFIIAGADKVWQPADATIDGEDILVRSAAVATPVAARYAWDVYGGCDLKDKAGLLASPFRTDNWPQRGEDKK